MTYRTIREQLEQVIYPLQCKIRYGEYLDQRAVTPNREDFMEEQLYPAWIEYFRIPGIHKQEFQARIAGSNFEIVGTGSTLYDAAVQVLHFAEFVLQVSEVHKTKNKNYIM